MTGSELQKSVCPQCGRDFPKLTGFTVPDFFAPDESGTICAHCAEDCYRLDEWEAASEALATPVLPAIWLRLAAWMEVNPVSLREGAKTLGACLFGFAVVIGLALALHKGWDLLLGGLQ